MDTARRRMFAAIFAFAAATLPGCIAWEIKDEMRAANQRLDETDGVLIETSNSIVTANSRIEAANDRIDTTNSRIEETITRIDGTQSLLREVHASIQQANTQLTQVQAALKNTDSHLEVVTGTIGDTRPLLTTANSGLDQLKILQEIQQTLTNINTALVPLQKTMAAFGSTMSFFGMGGEEEPIAAAPVDDTARAATPTAPAPAGSEPAAPVAARSSNFLVGTWLLAHPTPSTETAAAAQPRPADVFIMLSDGNYLEGSQGKLLGGGKWALSGATLKLTPSSSGKQPGSEPERTFDIVTTTPRSLTIRSASDFRVYARP